MSAARAILAALAGLLLCAAAQAQELNSEFVSQSVPPLMTAGQSYPVSVTLKNTGTWGWGTTSGHFLGSQNPQDNTNWGLNRVPLPQFVGPGQNVTFSFNVTAPATAGTYNFQWRMVNPATYGWFGATTPNVSVQVNVADAAFVSQSVPATMVAGQSASVSITLQNTGGTTWAPGSTALGSQNPQDNSAWGLNRVALPAPVAPGASATFNFSISAPSTPGTYNFQWRMLEGTNGWFGAPSTNVAVSVISGTPDANVFFIHTDHLNTPRLVANAAGQAVWRHDQAEPFGVNAPDENPSGLGAFEFPLRDEGTYADKETNLVYNWNRYRDLDSGRFIQADPLGLDGGDLSLYVLRTNSPLLFTDPYGLQSEIEGGRGSGFPGWLNPSAQAQQRLARQLSRMFRGQQQSVQQCKPDNTPNCQEHFTRCLGTSMADLPGSVYGSNRCLLCRDACVRGGGNWPDIAMTGGRSVRCDYWNYK